MNKKIILTLMGMVAVSTLAVGVTIAYFTYSKTSDQQTIASGTLSLDDAGISSFVLGDVAGHMAPGETTEPVVITIKNDGDMPLMWFGDLIANGDGWLKEAIYIDNAKMEFVDQNGVAGIGNWLEPTDNFITDGRGSGSFPTWYNTLADLPTSHFGVDSLNVFDGNNGMGDAPYEFMGALKPGYSYRLTLKFGFAGAAGNEYQGRGPLNLSFKVDATQVKAAAIHAVNSSWDASYFESWANTQISHQI